MNEQKENIQKLEKQLEEVNDKKQNSDSDSDSDKADKVKELEEKCKKARIIWFD